MKRVLVCVLFVALWAACNSGGGGGTTGSGGNGGSMPDAGFKSDCGHPGDMGNALGVGMFCQSVADCVNNTQATLCTTLGSATNFFCTFACKAAGPANQCGENATCECSTGGCGCFPNSCLGDGGAPDSGAPDTGTDSGMQDAADGG